MKKQTIPKVSSPASAYMLARSEPRKALIMLWKEEDISQVLFVELPNWLYIGMTQEGPINDHNGKKFLATQARFIEFYKAFLTLIEGSYLYAIGWDFQIEHERWPTEEEFENLTREKDHYSCVYVEDSSHDGLLKTMGDFCSKFEYGRANQHIQDLLRTVEADESVYRQETSRQASIFGVIFLTVTETVYALTGAPVGTERPDGPFFL